MGETRDIDPHGETIASDGAAATPALDATVTDAGATARRPPRDTGSFTGKTLAHYEIVELLGKGGMGEVYLATDTALDRKVAIKVLPREVAEDERLRARFFREARSQARLNHPNVCHIYFVGEEEGLLFFAMEYIEGESLQQRLDRDGPLPPEDAVELCRMAALGLREAHRHGFSHRDIKPSNLMVDRHGTVKVVDFGLVKKTAAEVAGDVAVTQSGIGVDKTALVGTPLYMAPEQARGAKVDHRSDIYSLGATLHALVSGQPPFRGESAMEILSQQLTEVRPRLAPRTRRRRGPAPLDALVDRMMAKSQNDRFSDYEELIAELERISPSRTRPAGFFVRAFAAMLDFLTITILAIPLVNWGPLPDPRAAMTFLLIVYAIFLQGRWGRTLGKAALEIEVVPTEHSGRVGYTAAAMRFLLQLGPVLVALGFDTLVEVLWTTSKAMDWISGIAVALAFLYPLLDVLLASWMSPSKQTVWDRWSKTQVRYRRR